MPRNSHPNMTIDIKDNTIRFRYECWKDENTGEGLILVHGRTDADHALLAQNRAMVAERLKTVEDMTSLRLFESQRNGLFSELRLEMDAKGHIISAVNANSHLGFVELIRQGNRLLDREHQTSIDLTQHEFREQPGINRIKTDPGHDL